MEMVARPLFGSRIRPLLVNGPSFDASLAYASLTFMGPDIAEGIAAIREKRTPKFSAGSPL